MIKDIEGIILDERAYGETSKIINILTKEYGIIGVIAKGSRTLKSELRSVTGKLTYGIFHMYYKENKLSTLISVDVLNTFKNIKKDIMKITYSSFILDLAHQVAKQNYQTDIYNLLIASLVKIEENFDPLVITNILELKYLSHLGVIPALDASSICRNKENIITLSIDKGGYICRECHTNEKIVDTKTIKLIRMFYYVDISKITKLEISNKVKEEINEFLDNYYDKYTGLYLKTKTLLKDLNRIG